ncbi:MAG: phosphatase PAP2 family protein [Lachnospiraceae bacterium]|nr:phosphatase PAP2 family protein [Lachnospiraceae bacterium]
MKKYYEKYKHAIPLCIYAVIYIVWFTYLERTVKRPENLIHMKLDDVIPFCEVFVIPYFLWFAYVSITVIYFFFKDKQGYYRLCTLLFTGMTVFLVISTLWPNGHHLRPNVMPRDNVFTALITHLYHTDTPTNLWPSIHVYNSLGAHFAIIKSPKLSRKPVIHIGSLILCFSIILSTMFIKQHSVFDVLTAFIMGAGMYIVVYGFDIVTLWQEHRIGSKKHRIRQV